MPRRVEIYIGERYYPKKQLAEAAVREVLYRYDCNVRIPQPDHSFLCDLLARHPNATEKIGVGIDHFEVQEDHFKNRCFHVYRVDGSSTDFGYVKALSGEKRDALVRAAMRTAIRYQKETFRDKKFAEGVVTCPYTNEVLNPDNCHVDHTFPYTFKFIAEQWLAASSMTYADVKISPSEDNGQGRRMTDPLQIESWTAFHGSLVQFRVLSPTANLSHAKIEGNRL